MPTLRVTSSDGEDVVSSVVAAPDDCPITSSTHEFGHCFGGIHERDDPGYSGADCTSTAMESGWDKCNVFSLPNAATLSDCAETNSSTLSFGGTDYDSLDDVERRDCPNVDEEPLIPAP